MASVSSTPAFSEGVLLAARADIDPRPGVEAMGASSIGSPMLQTRLPSLRNLPDDALFTIRLLRKDIHLALDEAQRLAVPLRSAAVAADILTKADALGYANRDIAGIHEVLDRLSRSTV
jgi:3-hydroxyisobutyrate dehydrogenase